jgi:hypothetical protein
VLNATNDLVPKTITRAEVDNPYTFNDLTRFIEAITPDFPKEVAQMLADNFHIHSFSEKAHGFLIDTLSSIPPEISAAALETVRGDLANVAYAQELAKAFRSVAENKDQFPQTPVSGGVQTYLDHEGIPLALIAEINTIGRSVLTPDDVER